jgi:hypothetical protein
MVVQGDFQVQLVEAKSKTPFKEHVKGNKTYVEVEPNVEFFVSIQKIGSKSSRGIVLVKPIVDNQGLGWRKSYLERRKEDHPDYFGLFQRVNGTVSTTALKFIQPDLDNAQSVIGMGTVEIKKIVSHFLGERRTSQHGKDYTNDFATEGVSFDEARSFGMKCVRSKTGEFKISEQVSSKRRRPGLLLDVITLHYCSLPGLMYAGVIPMPTDIYKSHRIMKGLNKPPPPLALVDTKYIRPKRVRVTKIVEMEEDIVSKEVTCYDLYDFSSLPSDDDDEE